nr:pathogenicity island protein [Mammaliicoccus sciuri]
MMFVCDFERDDKYTEHELLMKFNPRMINSTIKAITEQIDCMYSLNTSHVILSDTDEIMPVSCPLDDLVIYIVEEKEKLEYYKRKSKKRLNTLKRVISQYTPEEQKNVMRYMATNGRIKDKEVIDRLQVDLYKAWHKTGRDRPNKYIQKATAFKEEVKSCQL